MVADHLMHFTLSSLGRAAASAGLESLTLSDSVLPKELTWLGRTIEADRDQISDAPAHRPGAVLKGAEEQFGWLVRQREHAQTIAQSSDNFGILGTSISGTWLHGAMTEDVAFFVDEDAGRVNRKHLGLPVLAPSEVASGSDVYVPLIPKIAEHLVKRLSGAGTQYHAALDLPAFEF